MRYRVIGANAQTGTEVSTSVTAQDMESAKKIARNRGILIESVKLEGGDTADYEATDGTPKPLPLETISGSKLIDVSAGAAFKFGFFAAIGTTAFWFIISFIALIVAVLRGVGH